MEADVEKRTILLINPNHQWMSVSSISCALLQRLNKRVHLLHTWGNHDSHSVNISKIIAPHFAHSVS
jgi:hypothetical protein